MDDASGIAARVAAATGLPERGVGAALALFAEGATVPFVARYRKEATGSLDEVQLRQVAAEHRRLEELEARRATVLSAIEEQGELSPDLRAAVVAAKTRTALEDLYLPYKKRKRTRADHARERGLEPLADRMMAQRAADRPSAEAQRFVSAEVPDVEAALAGARDVVAERVAERPRLRGRLRWLYAKEGRLTARLKRGVDPETSKYATYADFSELARTIRPHRTLALARGEHDGELKVGLSVDGERALALLREEVGIRASPWAEQLELALRDAFTRLLAPSLEREMRGELEERAQRDAVKVFARNLEELLLAAPLGPKAVLGVDPGLRTGSKCAVVSAEGALLAHEALFLARGQKERDHAAQVVRGWVRRFSPEAIAVGNGTGNRESEAFLRDLVEAEGWSMPVVSVSEAGASVYSASDIAREELPDVDLTVRGAVSIARRLQDPLAELVKIDPKSIGVGQYQHDVKPALLHEALDAVVEDCVHRVGVDLATASAPLLARVSGIGPKTALRIVEHRQTTGGFGTRGELLKVKGVGKKAFELAAGFLRVHGSDPLDASAVHPERYAVVRRMAKDLGVPLAELVGNERLASTIEVSRYEGGDLGRPTLEDIRGELAKPGRDPRADFEPPGFSNEVRELGDLAEGMILPGVVTNVTGFGAFVDVGVHQDGLVHVSELSDRWVADPSEVVRAGQPLRVRVLSVDVKRRRISLSAKGVG